MVQLEQEINRQIAISLAKKRGPWAKYSKGMGLFSHILLVVASLVMFRIISQRLLLLQIPLQPVHQSPAAELVAHQPILNLKTLLPT